MQVSRSRATPAASAASWARNACDTSRGETSDHSLRAVSDDTKSGGGPLAASETIDDEPMPRQPGRLGQHRL
jgi:hypothetical protein